MTDRTVVYRLRAEAAQFKAEVAGAGAAVRKAAGDMTAATADGEKYRRGLTTVGDTAGKVGLVAAGSLAAMAKSAIDWESAWAGVTKTVDGSASQMADLEEGLRGLATTLPATHEEIAGVAEAAGQLGVAREDILDFTKTMIDLGETTNLTAEDAATSIAQIANVMGTTGDEIDNFGAALVALGNDGASTEAQILDMTQRIAGAGAQIGLAETDILAIANAAASMGIEAEAGGSAISKVFTELAKATSSGGPKLEKFAEIAGTSIDEFVQAFEEDPARAFNMFTDGLDRVNKSGGDVFTTLKDVGLDGIRVSQALLGMAASGDLLADSLELGKTAWTENTALALEAAKRYDTTSSEIKVSWNRIKDAGIEAGETLLPVVAGAADAVGDLADAFGSLPGPVQDSMTGLLGITAVFGGGLWFTSKVINGVAGMKGALVDVGISGEKAAGGLGKAAKAAGVLGGAFAVVTVVDSFLQSTDKVAPGMEEMTRALMDLSDAASGSTLPDELDTMRASIDRLINPTGWEQSDDIWNGILGDTKSLKEAKLDIESLDGALANLATSSGIRASEQAFEDLAESLGITVSEQIDLREEMPQYRDAIAGIQNETAKAATATDDQAVATAGLTTELQDAEAAAEDFKDLMESLNAALSGRGEMRDYEAAIDDFTKTLKENGDNFDINTEKGRENQAMLDNIASSALAVADEMSQADRRKFLTQAIKDLRTMGAEMGLPKSEVKALIELLRTANQAEVNPKVDVDTAASLAKIQAVRNSIESLRDRSLTITTVYKVVGNAGDAIPYRGEADGGVLDFYANGGLRENHVAQIAPAGAWRVWAEEETGGEAYIPLAASKRARSIDIWEEVGARLGVEFERFAAGSSGKGGESDAEKKARAAREKARRAAEERARREEEKRQRRLDAQRTKDLLASDLRDEEAQQRLELRDAQRRLKSAKKADRSPQEIREAKLAVKEERADVRDMREQRAQEAEEERNRIAQEAEDERIRIAEEAARRQKEIDDAVLDGQTRAWDMATDAAQAQVDAAQTMVDTVQANMDRIGEAATSAFSGSWFGGGQDRGLWTGSGAGDWRSKAQADVAGLEERSALITQLSGLGLTGPALEDLLGNQSNEGIAAMIQAGEIDDFAAFFAQREALMTSVQQQAGQAGYGADMAAANAHLAHMNNQFAALTAAIEAARPITVLEAISAQATAQELVRLMSLAGAS